MTSQPGAAQLCRGFRQRAPLPSKGTKMRNLYEKLRSGQVVSKGNYGSGFSSALTHLRDFYGVELETKRGRYGFTRMIGEWDGDFFVPIERILQDDAQ